MKSHALAISVIFVSCSILTGCATNSNSSNSSGTSPLAQQESQKELDAAWRLFKNQQYHEAIPNLLHLLSRYRNTPASIESRYLLALSYYEIQSFKDSIQLFNDYLKWAPQGKYADESKRSIERISIAYEARFPSDISLKSDIKRLENELAATPQSVLLKIELAHLYWKLGSYAQAGDYYVDVAQSDPSFRRDQTFNERIDLNDDGSFQIITPDEQTRRAIENEPLVITNTNSFRSGRDLFTRERKYYVVSGQVVNRGNETMYGVEVFATIYGFGNAVWDTRRYNVGLMHPGETRAFSFRFQNFRNIDAINHYDCKVTYQRS